MSDNDKREAPERVRRIAAALRQRTTDRGCSEAEAMEAAAKLAELEDEYWIARDAIGERDEIEEAVFAMGKRMGNVARAADGIAAFTDTQYVYLWRRINGERVRVIAYTGFQSDTAFALYLTEMLHTMMKVKWQVYQIERRRNAHWETSLPHLKGSFEIGMMDRVTTRLYDLKRERNDRIYTGGRTGNELVVVKGALVETAFKDKYPKIKTMSFGAALHEDAAIAGQKAGNAITFERPIERDKKERLT